MTKTIGAVLVLGAVAFGGVGGWYLSQEAAERARADEFDTWAKQQKVVDVKFIVRVPSETPGDQQLYLSGSAAEMGAWQAAGVPLARQPDGTYVASVPVMSGIEHAFKINRSTWGTVERGAAGEEIPNHTFTAKDDKTAVEVQVASWVDKGKSIPGRITITGMIHHLPKIHSDLLGNDRDLYVYLPPGYDADGNEQRYPVLYMQDGQNLFNEATSFNSIEWKVDEAAEKLIKEGKMQPVIIVGICNSEQRNAEFTPAAMSTSEIKGTGENYGKFIIETVKKQIDQTYRTQPDQTGIAGSSMGGQITLAMLKQYPDVFGKAAVLTPHLRNKEKEIYSGLGDNLAFLKGKTLWIDMGSAGGDNYIGKDPIADAKQFVQKLEASGLSPGKDFKYTEYPNGEHNEPAWQGRIGEVLAYLYGK